jgi:hypothetical protein
LSARPFEIDIRGSVNAPPLPGSGRASSPQDKPYCSRHRRSLAGCRRSREMRLRMLASPIARIMEDRGGRPGGAKRLGKGQPYVEFKNVRITLATRTGDRDWEGTKRYLTIRAYRDGDFAELKEKLDLDWLLRVRTVVARCGEMDAQRWWNTQGQLGPYGAKVLWRGFPRTHYFAQARSVFAVAAHRCAVVFDPPDAVTFWRLSDEVEEAVDARWEGWLDGAPTRAPFFDSVAALKGFDVAAALKGLSLVDDADVEAAATLKVADDGSGALTALKTVARVRSLSGN